MKHTKIICTIGPASHNRDLLVAMMRAGMNVARLNLSHGTHKDHHELIRLIRMAARESGGIVPIIGDLQGPKIRLGELPKEGVRLQAGEEVIFMYQAQTHGLKNGFKSDSVYYDDSTCWEEWESCAEYTYFTDDEGFEVMIVDYGVDGCEEWGELIKGKITWKWRMNNEGYAYENIYENYSSWGMSINGYYKGESQWTGTWNEEDFEDSTYFYNWFSDDSEEISTNEENMTISFDGGEIITYVSNFKSKFTFNSYTMLEGSFSYVSSLGDSYTWDIIEPIISDFTCIYWIPVSGIEEGTFNEDTYSIDYGDGTCDNKYTITVNGVSEEIEINYDDIWISDGDDGTTTDSTNVSGR